MGGRPSTSAARRRPRYDARRLQLRELVLDERQQRGHHQRRPLEHQRRKLVGQRFAAAGRHDRQRVAAGQHRFYDLGLPGAQVTNLEYLAHLLERAQQRGRGRLGGRLLVDRLGRGSRFDAVAFGRTRYAAVVGVGSADDKGRDTILVGSHVG